MKLKYSKWKGVSNKGRERIPCIYNGIQRVCGFVSF